MFLKYIAICAVGLTMAADAWSKNEKRGKCLMNGGDSQDSCEAIAGCYWSGQACVTDCSVIAGKGPCQNEEKSCSFSTSSRECSNKTKRPE